MFFRLVNSSQQDGTGEERRRQTGEKTANLVWSVTIILFEAIFRQTSLSFEQIFFRKDQKTLVLCEDHDKTRK